MHIDKYYDKSTEMYLMDGTHYETGLSLICHGMLETEDCDEVAQIILDTLIHLNARPETGKYHDDLVREIFGGVEGAAYITLSILDNKGFVDYGVSIRGAWPEPSGLELIDDLIELLK